jgi:hypothetical protein
LLTPDEIKRGCEPHFPWIGDNSHSDFSNVNFLFRVDGKPIGITYDDYARLIATTFGINKPIERHIELINQGYLVPCSEVDSLKALRYNEMRKILKDHGLNAGGKKTELVQRILDNINIFTLSLRTVYKLSEIGKEYVTKNKYLIDVVPYLDDKIFTLDEFIQCKTSTPSWAKMDDLLWSIYNAKTMYYSVFYNHFMLRMTTLRQSDVLRRDGDFDRELNYLVLALLFDLNGTRPYCNYEYLFIAPRIANRIHDLKSYYWDGITELAYQTLDYYRSTGAHNYKNDTGEHYIPPDTFPFSIMELIVNEVFDKGEIDLQNYKQYANDIFYR